MTRTVNANSVKIVPEGSQEGILLSVSQDGKLATNKIDNQGNVDNQESALTSDFISLTDTPATFEAEKYLKVNAEGNALEFSDISISTDFISLTDTPETLDAGSYLRVNTTGDAIEQVKTAPPDGGIGDNDTIQEFSNFNGKLPDVILVSGGTGSIQRATFYGVTANKIQYLIWSDNSYYVDFDNDSTGNNATFMGAAASGGWNFLNGSTTLQEVINNGHAIYHGQKSGTSGVGSLSAIKSSSNFYTELPDAIVCQEGTDEVILTLQRIQTGIIQYRNEDHGISSSDDRYIYFNNNSDGTFSSKNQSYWTGSMSDNSLRWFIENGRALYYGSDPVSSRIGQLEDITTLIPLANQIDIPDAILGSDGAGNLRLFKFTQARADRFDYQSNTNGSNYLFAFDSATGAWIGGIHAVNVTKEYDDIQGYIAAGRALYYGRTGSNLGQLIANVDDLSDVDTSTIAPINGQVLVYDESDSKWKPGAQSTDFVDLTDTPAALDAGSYLRVNTTGDAIEQVKTAPPDGGRGDNSLMQAKSKFAGKLPDCIVVQNGNYTTALVLRAVYDGDAAGSIEYMDPYGGGNGYISFYNNPTGDGIRVMSGSWVIPNGRTRLQDIIDDGNVVYHGQKSGTSGVGSLSAIKSSSNFYTELPDAIVHEESGIEYILTLSSIDANGTLGIFYRNEDHGDGTTQDRRITFDNNADGDINPSLTIFFTAADNLRWYIENGRALYYGSEPSISRIGQLQEIIDNVPLASSVELPNAILDYDSGSSTLSRILHFEKVENNDHFQYKSNDSVRYIRFDGTTGSRISKSSSSNGDFGSIQEYISNSRALYYGVASNAGIGVTDFTGLEDTPATLSADKILKTNSTGDQIILVDDVEITSIDDIADVQTSGAGHDPADGDALVWNESHGHWMPGEITSTFAELTDTPSTLNAGSYLRVNSTGGAIEQVKTAPPDGGAGDNSAIQAASNFAGKLPDQIVLNYTDSGHSGVFVFSLRGILKPEEVISYHDEFNDGAYRIQFTNNATGTFVANTASSFATPFEGATASLQDIIDGGHAIYHGQKSGTSGVGSLSYLKTLTNQSINGGFYTELPDAIFVESLSDTYHGLFHLQWVKPNSTLTDTTWEAIYRVEAFSSSDYYIGFKLDADGTKVSHGGVVHTNATSKNLRWYIENGRAIYNGGYNESNTVSARIAADGTIVSSNYDWIDTVTKNGAGDYTITFKPGHFTSVPSIVLGADFVDGVGHITAEYNQLSVNSCVVYIRSQSAAQVIDGGFSIMAQHQDRPIALAAPQYGIKAWGKFDGTGSGSLSFNGGNIQSIVRVSTGLYKVTFINPAPDADYSVSGSVNPNSYGGAYFGVREDENPVTTTDFHIELRDSANSLRDSNRISFQVSY